MPGYGVFSRVGWTNGKDWGLPRPLAKKTKGDGGGLTMGVYPDFGNFGRIVGQAGVMAAILEQFSDPVPRLFTLTAIVGADGRLYRAAIFEDSDGGLFGECFDFPPPLPTMYVFGAGDTLAECRQDLREGIAQALARPETALR